ncbi:M28 family peptidase [Shewanella litorisediminis]|uniref:M28 family peptidase n=1 Tax=Shewanella litorisediminis TaxID=1173586 RepID=A0ABX7G4X1_9GAMM|nr:M28 family peptidase [Shewanella litorisediminis]MCL2917871.1 M28 family peptidase [Shewanella litorisediminis]QRH02307.1 M28 family peptidase [Shewanella litorisediminis]
MGQGRLGYQALGAALLASWLSGCATTPQCRRDLSVDWVTLAAVQEDVTYLASAPLAGRKTGTEGALLTRQYLAARFAASGLQPVTADFSPMAPGILEQPAQDSLEQSAQNSHPFFHPFSVEKLFSQQRGTNVIGLLPATRASTRWRLVLAHYDHLGKSGSRHFAGADDNASGVAALLALAKQAASDPERPADLNLLFVATDAEEPGLYGSQALATRLGELGIVPELALNLDMVGHPGRPYAIYMEGSRNFANADELRALVESNGLCARLSHSRLERDGSAMRVNYLKASDHYPFHKSGVPWLYFGVPPHPQYHTVDDTPDKLDFNFLAATIEAVYPLLWTRLEPKPPQG